MNETKLNEQEKYMNYTSLFYWLTVADNAKDFFITFIEVLYVEL